MPYARQAENALAEAVIQPPTSRTVARPKETINFFVLSINKSSFKLPLKP